MSRLTELWLDTQLAGIEMDEERSRFDRLRDRHTNGTAPRAVTSFNLFQTPEHIAAQMADMLPKDAKRILEPSAGLGRLYKAAAARLPHAEFVLIDESPDCIRELYGLTEGERAALMQQDFIHVSPDEIGKFDAIIMNPPFERGRDVRHILHAAKFLNPRGFLVGLCYAGATQERLLRPHVTTWEPLPAKSFKESGTNVDVIMITIEKEF